MSSHFRPNSQKTGFRPRSASPRSRDLRATFPATPNKAVLCRLQCFRTYSCIFGLTGSLGQDAEKQYLMQYYDAVTWNVPYFLDTCRGDEDKSPFVKGEMVKIVSEEGDSAGLRQRKGTKNSLGRLLDVGRDSLLVDLGDGKEVKYMPTCIEKCVSSKKAPKNIGGDKPLEGLDAQERLGACRRSVREVERGGCSELPRSSMCFERVHERAPAPSVPQQVGAALWNCKCFSKRLKDVWVPQPLRLRSLWCCVTPPRPC